MLMLNVECYSATKLFGLPYQHMMIGEDDKNASVFTIESQSEDESTRDRSDNPTHADGYMQLFPRYILPLFNVYRYANDCASREMQLCASQPII